jgi:hypothetical protein
VPGTARGRGATGRQLSRLAPFARAGDTRPAADGAVPERDRRSPAVCRLSPDRAARPAARRGGRAALVRPRLGRQDRDHQPAAGAAGRAAGGLPAQDTAQRPGDRLGPHHRRGAASPPRPAAARGHRSRGCPAWHRVRDHRPSRWADDPGPADPRNRDAGPCCDQLTRMGWRARRTSRHPRRPALRRQLAGYLCAGDDRAGVSSVEVAETEGVLVNLGMAVRAGGQGDLAVTAAGRTTARGRPAARGDRGDREIHDVTIACCTSLPGGDQLVRVAAAPAAPPGSWARRLPAAE